MTTAQIKKYRKSLKVKAIYLSRKAMATTYMKADWPGIHVNIITEKKNNQVTVKQQESFASRPLEAYQAALIRNSCGFKS